MNNGIQPASKNNIQSGNINKKPVYKRWYFWVIIVVVLIGIAGASENSDTSTSTSSGGSQSNVAKVKIIDFSSMADEDIQKWCNDNGVTCKTRTEIFRCSC